VDLMNPTRRDAVIEAGLAQGRRLGDAPERQAA
jgi:hypothetical protein